MRQTGGNVKKNATRIDRMRDFMCRCGDTGPRITAAAGTGYHNHHSGMIRNIIPDYNIIRDYLVI